MISVLRGIASRCVYRTLSSPPLLRALRRKAIRSGEIAVLMYHEIAPREADIDAWAIVRRDDFLRQLEYLTRHYDVITLDDAIAQRMRQTGRARPTAVLTLDDGCVGNLELVAPALHTAGVPATIFIATGQVRSGKPYWFDRIANAVQTRAPLCLDLRRLGLGTYLINACRGAANWDQIRRLLDDLKAVEEERRDDAVRLVEDATGGLARRVASAFTPLDVAGVQELARSPWITIGAHTDCHRILTRVPRATAEASISLSRSLLESWTGKPIRHFAFPSNEHDSALISLVKDLRFDAACVGGERLWGPGDSLFAIPRLGIGRYDSFDVFRVHIAGGPRQILRSVPAVSVDRT